MSEELLAQRSVNELKIALTKSEPVVYRDNGNRSRSGAKTFRHLQQILPRIGVTRIGEIGHLIPRAFPTFQSTRPKTLAHFSFGMNTGSQGKGFTALQAKISCMMESIESYCVESRNAHLVRATYNELKNRQRVADPRIFIHYQSSTPATVDEPFLWTSAYHVESGTSVLIPGETIYFNFFTTNTRITFPSSTNGLAGGTTYLEAVTHALYELIERKYESLFEAQKAWKIKIQDEDIRALNIAEFNEAFSGEMQIEVYAVLTKQLENLPVTVCYLNVRPLNRTFRGNACASDLETSIARSISEAFQSYATFVSGSREDIAKFIENTNPLELATPETAQAGQPLEHVKLLMTSEIHKNLRTEFNKLVKWIHSAGYHNIFIANLTRVGIEIPVVKVVIPGLPVPIGMRSIASLMKKPNELSKEHSGVPLA